VGETFWTRLNTLQRVRPSLYRQGRFDEMEDAVHRLIADGHDAAQRNNARSILVSLHQYRGDFEPALAVIEAQIEEKADDLQAWLALTEHHHYAKADLARATNAVEMTLSLATQQAFLVRQVLGVRMRIALATCDFDKANETLSRLIDYKPPAHSLDVAYEVDFLENVPAGAIDAALISRYSELLSAT